REEHALRNVRALEQPAAHVRLRQESDVDDDRHACQMCSVRRYLIVLLFVDVNEIDPENTDTPREPDDLGDETPGAPPREALANRMNVYRYSSALQCVEEVALTTDGDRRLNAVSRQQTSPSFERSRRAAAIGAV